MPPQYQPAPQPTYPPSPQGNDLKKMIQDSAATIFIGCVMVLTAISILGVWKVFSNDVITKSFETFGLLGFVAIVVIVAARFVGNPDAPDEIPVSRPGYRATRNITLATLIGSAALLALLGVLSIWDVITDKAVLNKTLSSLAIIAFSSLVIVLLCLERERNQFWQKHNKSISGWSIFGVVIVIWLFISLVGRF